MSRAVSANVDAAPDARPLRRIALVLPPTGRYCREDRCQSYFAPDLLPSMRPPLEEVEASAGIRTNGGLPWLLDAPAEDLEPSAALDQIAAFDPDAVVLTATFGSLIDDVAFAEQLRQRLPAIPIGLRGGPVYALGAELLKRHAVLSFLIHGEPELTFGALCHQGLTGPGVIRRSGKNAPPPVASDLNTLPWADRSVLAPSLYRVRGTSRAQATIHVQRGCPFPCSYCLVSVVSGKKARHRDPSDVAREMRALQADGFSSFYLRADTLTLDQAWARELADAIATGAPGVTWISTTRVELADAETLRRLARSGCYGLSFGVETGSEAIGARIHKPPDLSAATAAFRRCDEVGISSLMYVMLGFYWETRATLEETGRFITSARPDLLTMYWAHPYPGTA